MTNRRTYSPRRAAARWLGAAPAYVLDVWDNGGRTADRFTVFLFGDGWGVRGRGPGDTRVPYLAMSTDPTSPQGFSQFGEISAHDRAGFAFERRGGNRRISWADLPDHIREHVRNRCEGSRRIESLNRGVRG